MRNIYTVGESTYDIVFKNNQPSHAIVGGSALNTSVSLGRLRLPVHFISRLGNDKIGKISTQFLQENGVNIENIIQFGGNSRISIAFMDEKNIAEYQFYSSHNLPSLQFTEPTIEDIISFGSSVAIQDEGRGSFLHFLKQATNKGALTIYDPNIRESDKIKLLKIRQKVENNLGFTHILKGSDQDFYRLYETTDAEKIFEKVNPFGIKFLIVTAGEKPVQLITPEISKSYTFKPFKTVNTIGAGDNFTAGIIAGFYKHHINSLNINLLSEYRWDEIIGFGNSFASEVCKSEVNYISTDFASRFSESFLRN